MADYTVYTNYVHMICDRDDLSSFKRHPNYQYMLEHVSQEQGQAYLNCILTGTPIPMEAIQSFCELNDRLGSPITQPYGALTCSPTSLRYLYHAHLILSYFKTFNLPSYKLVEVGGGYGGLCLAIHTLAPQYGITLESYTIIDLLAPSRLQEKYISMVSLHSPISFLNAEQFGANLPGDGYFLISNYCFSEISPEFQKRYIDTLFPKLVHGFIAWNMIPTYTFGFSFREEPEVPKTGPMNKYVYF
jgi:hypothetical protein